MKFDMANPKVDLLSFLTIGAMSVTFILIAKIIFNKWHVVGVTDVVNAI